MTPVLSTAIQFSGRAPMALTSSRVAMPAAPAPHNTSLTSSNLRPVISQALIRPAQEMIAVPC